MKKILVIDAHPVAGSYGEALADAYEKGAKQSGHEIERLSLRDLDFDPIRHVSMATEQTWEPDLERAWELLQAAEHLCLVYPTWWGGHPALLQGFFERVFISGKTFKYHDNDPLWDKLMVNKSARIITTMDTPGLFYHLIFRNSGVLRIKKTILEFCGYRVAVKVLRPMRQADEAKRKLWLEDVEALGKAGV